MNTYSTTFILRNVKARKEEGLIYCRITVNQQRAEFSVKKKIRKSIWQNGQAKSTSEEGRSVNAYLKQVEATIFQYYQEMKAGRMEVTAEGLKNAYLGIKEEAAEHTLLEIVHYHNTQMKSSLAPGTMKNYFTTQKYLQRFLLDVCHQKDIYLSKLNYRFICDFEYFLRTYEPEDHHKPLGNNGVMKHLERFRKMVNLALRMEWLEKNPFASFKLKFDKVERECLTKEELAAVEKKVFEIPRLQMVRDFFIFSCYTGLAYIDLMQLEASNIVTGVDGDKWLILDRQKTGSLVRVPLLPKALEILEQYKNHKRAIVAGRVFPPISNQKLNSYLKEVADVCGIEKHLTFHLARHTFATTITLSNGVPIESVSKMLGHSMISTTQIYAKVVERKLSEDMGKLKKKLQEASF
ncbi:site-specific integrase [Nafulsella turpanensis]|uniref:site-specific integrase n=1 Tax=Nafulsella turpanensis TaxID=1265690 RepID=UPI000346BB0D|nr:site-specific integrase [Nafulsella turpanensis]